MKTAAMAVAILLLACAGGAGAAEHVHRAHEHGSGILNVAVEGATVEIELIAPGSDIVGFEHPATSDADRQAVEAAAATLRDGSGLFVFPDAADCSLAEAVVESGLLHAGEHADEDEHADEEEHAETEDHAGEEEHAETEAHAEFRARYRFDCAEPESLDSVELRYFDVFPAARELDVSLATEDGQAAVELTPDAARLDL